MTTKTHIAAKRPVGRPPGRTIIILPIMVRLTPAQVAALDEVAEARMAPRAQIARERIGAPDDIRHWGGLTNEVTP